MTFETIEKYARGYARTSTSGVSQSDAFEMINQAIVEFGRDAKGMPMEEYLAIDASFDLYTHQGFHLTITGSSNNDIDSDIAVTDTDTNNMTGTEVATELQAQIRAAIGGSPDLTVSWTKFYFTIDAIDSTTIAVTEPDDSVNYTDYTEELFGGSLSASDTSVDGGFPDESCIEMDLAADCIKVQQVLWDNFILRPVTRDAVIDPEATGTPSYYNVRNNKIRLYPVPTEQKKLYIEYMGVPTEVSSPATSSTIPSIPEKYQRALAYWVAKEMLLYSFDDDLANRRYAEYKRIVNQYIADTANQSTAIRRYSVPVINYTVSTE